MSTGVTRSFQHQFNLKYGCNPQQKTAAVYQLEGHGLPFEILNGKPGYINLLDALNAWQLVEELDRILGHASATSFKHVSPAGAAIGSPLTDPMAELYGVDPDELSELAKAYVKARGADPKSSFGDFIALSRTVDVPTAKVIKTAVSDGVIAPDYEPEALAMLKAKKKGNYLVLKANPDYQPPETEFREVFGVCLEQSRNRVDWDLGSLHEKVVTKNKKLSDAQKRDLILASITLKYTQSNSVGYAIDGQMIGIGAGQQSRIDCTRLAGYKADIWFLRQHPKAISLPFIKGTKKVDRVNASIAYVEDSMTAKEREHWLKNFSADPSGLSREEKQAWLSQVKGVSLASDAFFPFRDNIDQASRHGVQAIIQPGGSQRDSDVIDAANEYNMTMVFNPVRLFHH